MRYRLFVFVARDCACGKEVFLARQILLGVIECRAAIGDDRGFRVPRFFRGCGFRAERGTCGPRFALVSGVCRHVGGVGIPLCREPGDLSLCDGYARLSRLTFEASRCGAIG